MISALLSYFGLYRLSELDELRCQCGWQKKQLQKLALERDCWQTRAGEMVDDLNEAEKQCESLTAERDDARGMVDNLADQLSNKQLDNLTLTQQLESLKKECESWKVSSQKCRDLIQQVNKLTAFI